MTDTSPPPNESHRMSQAPVSYLDANCTLGRFPHHDRGIAELADLSATLEELGIGAGVVRHALGQHASAEEANSALATELQPDPRWIPCWVVNPAQDTDGLDVVPGDQLRAVCLYPRRHGYPLAPWMVEQVLAPLEKRRVVTLIDVDETTPKELYTLCQAYQGLRVVALTTGYRLLGVLSRLLATCPNLHVELSTMAAHRGIEALVERHGAERLLFGTNTPLSDGIGPVAALGYAAISEGDRALIARGNLERLLGEVRR